MTRRPGRDATRRNRNIGTAKQGHGDDNDAVVPRRWRDSRYDWQRVPKSRVVYRVVWGRDMPFLVEPTRSASWHACTVDDVARMLNLLPKRHVNNYKGIVGIRGVVFQQPTRKEEQLRGVWGRLCFGVEVNGVSGPVIQLAATETPLRIRWGRHLKPDEQQELERLQSAAASSESDGRHHRMMFDIDAVRRVQLYHTIPHEIGHWADMFEGVELPSLGADLDTWKQAWDRYWQRPGHEHEVYADRYATQTVAGLREERHLPFDRMLDLQSLEDEGLRREDFVVAPDPA